MKRKALALIFILTFSACIAVGMSDVNVTNANFVPAAEILITSPANKTYDSNILVLNYTVYFTLTKNKIVVYSIDGSDNITIFNRHGSQFYETISDIVVLPELSDGLHHLAVHAVYAEGEGAPGFAEVYFTVDTAPPRISLLSIENKTYSSKDIQLDFTVNEQTSQISYSLDNKENVAIYGNTTLSGLAEGSHRLVVYANDTVGNVGFSETVHFAVAQATEFQIRVELFQLTLVIIVALVMVVVATFMYFKKRKHKR